MLGAVYIHEGHCCFENDGGGEVRVGAFEVQETGRVEHVVVTVRVVGYGLSWYFGSGV